ncbi:MAG: hypothetical protein K8T20_14630, partial [Planctomycetes bacterium]|nr:hypothetical protein [Planctomycetota bacterium]
QAEALRKRIDELDAKLDKHQEEISSSWNELLAEMAREDARRTVDGERLAGVVNSAGGKPVNGQVEELMDETARKRVKGMLRNWMDLEVGVLKSQISLAGSQAAAVDQVVADILKEEGEKVDSEGPGDNMIGWRGDVMQSARQKLQERLDPVLTSEQKFKAQDWFKEKDFGKGWREAQAKQAEGNK